MLSSAEVFECTILCYTVTVCYSPPVIHRIVLHYQASSSWLHIGVLSLIMYVVKNAHFGVVAGCFLLPCFICYENSIHPSICGKSENHCGVNLSLKRIIFFCLIFSIVPNTVLSSACYILVAF